MCGCPIRRRGTILRTVWRSSRGPAKISGENELRAFQLWMQKNVEAIIVAELKEHFGSVDPMRNEDLRDVDQFYTTQ